MGRRTHTWGSAFIGQSAAQQSRRLRLVSVFSPSHAAQPSGFSPLFLAVESRTPPPDRSNRSIRILPFHLAASISPLPPSPASPPPALGFYFSHCSCWWLLVVTVLFRRLPRSRRLRLRRRRRSPANPNDSAASLARLGEPELALRWRCSTWRRSGRRARTSPTGTPPSPTSTSGSCGTSSPSSSTNSYSSRQHRFGSSSSSS